MSKDDVFEARDAAREQLDNVQNSFRYKPAGFEAELRLELARGYIALASLSVGLDRMFSEGEGEEEEEEEPEQRPIDEHPDRDPYGRSDIYDAAPAPSVQGVYYLICRDNGPDLVPLARGYCYVGEVPRGGSGIRIVIEAVTRDLPEGRAVESIYPGEDLVGDDDGSWPGWGGR